MPRGLTTICHASRPNIGATKYGSYIWVSDDLLAHTFNTFVRAHRRHGSNVPGPLEARKRAAKRRTTTLAQIPSHPDPAIVMGSVTQPDWWKQPGQKKEPAKTKIWSLFAGRPHMPPPPPVPMVFALESDEKKKDERKTRRFLQSLSRVNTFESLIAQLERFSMGPIAQYPNLAQNIMDHMLDRRWEFCEIEKFLLDPITNPAGSLLFYHSFRYGLQKGLDRKRWQWFARHLVHTEVPMKAARLGLLCEEDIVQIFFLIVKEDEFLFNSQNNFTDFLHRLLNELEQSAVMDMTSVCKKMLHKLKQLMELHWYPSIPLLMHRLSSHADSKHTLSDTVVACLSHVNEDTGPRLGYLVNFILSQPHTEINRMIFQVTERLVTQSQDRKLDKLSEVSEEGRIDASLRATLIANLEISDRDLTVSDQERERLSQAVNRIFEEISEDSQSSDEVNPSERGKATLLQSWYAVLAGIGLNREALFVVETKYFKDFIKQEGSISSKGRILLAFWIATALSVHNNVSISTSRLRFTGQDALHEYGRECQAQGEDLLASIVTELFCLPLPAKNKLLRRMCLFSGGFLQVRVDYWQLLSLSTAIEKDQHFVLRDKSMYKTIKRHFPALLRKLSESFNSDLAAFEKAARTVICETKGSTKLILRLLAHNSELNFALRHAARLHYAAKTNTGPLRNFLSDTGASPKASMKAIGEYSYDDIVNMINNLAWDCARSEMLTPRLSFRFTWWLLMHLHMHRAPVLPTMLEAVWHSAVVRNPNVSYHVVRLLHSYNLEYLGEHGAQQMLLSSRYPKAEKVLASKPARKPLMSGGEAVAESLLAGWAEESTQPTITNYLQDKDTNFMLLANEDDPEDFLEEHLVKSSDDEKQVSVTS